MTSSSGRRSSSEENETFLELKSAKSVSLIEIRTIGENPRYGTRKRRSHQLTKIRLIAALSVVTLLVAVSIILYFAIMHYIATRQQSGSTETDVTSTNPVFTTSWKKTTSSHVTTRYNATSRFTTDARTSSTISTQTVTASSVEATDNTTNAVMTTEVYTEMSQTTEDRIASDAPTSTAPDLFSEKPTPNLTTAKPTLVTDVVTQQVQKATIVYVPGRFTFAQAKEECEKMGTSLAFKDDLQRAYEAGYERCIWGWLGDLHHGFVMQKSGARMECARGKWGVIYSKSYIDVDSVEKGAYCKTTPDKTKVASVPIEMTPKSVNWWVRLDPVDIYNLRNLLDFSWQTSVAKQPADASPSNLLGSVHAVYPCCNFFNITGFRDEKENRTYVALKRPLANIRYLASEYRRQFSDVQISILPHVSASYEAMMLYGAATTNRTQIIDDLVEKSATAGVDGVIIDYEPAKEYTREHAIVYRDFMNELDKKMKANSMEVGMMVSGWGILKFYDVYSTVECRMIGSMASTYSGRDVQRNINNVDAMLLHIATQRLQIGIGSMHDEEMSKPRRDFDWKPNELSEFLQHLTKVGVKHLHIFPGSWESIRWTEEFFMNSLLQFVRT